jgi:hypothetical protein
MGVFTGSAFAATPIEASIQQITGEVRLIIKRELPSGEINYEKRMVPADEAETREALLLQDPSVLLVERDTLAFSPIPMVSPIPATSQALLDGGDPVDYSDPDYLNQPRVSVKTTITNAEEFGTRRNILSIAPTVSKVLAFGVTRPSPLFQYLWD